jgi:ABC-type Fe3+/spermidine/putrescine transport system ATPase subunit
LKYLYSAEGQAIAAKNYHPKTAFVMHFLGQVNTFHGHLAGANVRLEFRSESGEVLQAELPQDRYRSLDVGMDSQVFVSPRSVKVFAADQSTFAHGEGI